jgi:type I restriction enzyme, R subunit
MSPITAEDRARHTIDTLLGKASWRIFEAKQANIHAARGVAIREFPLKQGHGEADYLPYVDGKAAGVIEAKKEGATLTGVEIQSAKYITRLPDGLPRWANALPAPEVIAAEIMEDLEAALATFREIAADLGGEALSP